MAIGPGYTLGEIADLLKARLEGDPAHIVTGVAPLESAGPGEISFLIDARHCAAARASRAGAVVAEPGVDGLPAAVRVRRGAKLDNLVQVGHNVDVGEHTILVAQVGVSGSTRLGRGVILAGQVGVADHVTIGDGAIVAAQSGVPSDVDPGARLLGSPARPAGQARRILAAQTRLPDLLGKVRTLARRLRQVEHRLGTGEERAGDAAG